MRLQGPIEKNDAKIQKLGQRCHGRPFESWNTVTDSKLHCEILTLQSCTWHCPTMPKRCSMALTQPVGTKGDASRHFVSGIETLPYLKKVNNFWNSNSFNNLLRIYIYIYLCNLRLYIDIDIYIYVYIYGQPPRADSSSWGRGHHTR